MSCGATYIEISPGVIYPVFPAAYLSQMQHDHRVALFSYASSVVSLGIQLSTFGTFLTPALKGDHLQLAFLTLSFFPFLMALVAVFVSVLTVRLVP